MNVQSLVLIGILLASPAMAHEEDLKLWYTQPASKWEEALPLGNGRLGAMVFGGAAGEHLQLNEDTLVSGYPGYRDLPLWLSSPGWRRRPWDPTPSNGKGPSKP